MYVHWHDLTKKEQEESADFEYLLLLYIAVRMFLGGKDKT